LLHASVFAVNKTAVVFHTICIALYVCCDHYC
jgi:hypothetical protein